MKKVNNWGYFILGFLVAWYGYFLIAMTFIGIFGVIINEHVKFITLITSTETIQSVLMSILLIISGDYLSTNSIDKEEV